MAKGKLIFNKIIQISQDLGGKDEHMVSRVFFDLEVGNEVHRGLYSDVKQALGTKYEKAPLEVSLPRGYKGPLAYGVFRRQVEDYYREGFGSTAKGIRLGPGVTTTMQDNVYSSKKVVDIEIGEKKGRSGW